MKTIIFLIIFLLSCSAPTFKSSEPIKIEDNSTIPLEEIELLAQ